MSRATRNASTALVTIWPRTGTDDFGRESFGVPYTLYGTFDVGSSFKYTNLGLEVTPKDVFWSETSDLDPKKGDYIAKGDRTAYAKPEESPNADVIKLVDISDCSFLGQPDDIMVVT